MGLGGFCLNLKNLSTQIKSESVFYGIQSYGINENEEPFKSIQEMALEDIKLIKKITHSHLDELKNLIKHRQIIF
jgi:thioesterase domain-containing protein